MTTKPKAKKFRIRRSTPSTGAAAQPAAPAEPVAPLRSYLSSVRDEHDAAAPADRAPARRAAPSIPEDQPDAFEMRGMVSSASETNADQDIDAIRREGLTGRQLRMARRVAQKHGLAPTSDFDAVRLLRTKGIDPFQRSTMLELVVPPHEGQAPGAAPSHGQIQLPQTVPGSDKNLPSTELSPADRRTNEIMAIQRDIGRRRRRKLILLMTRLSFFVFAPTLLVAWYFFVIASPLYATKSEFLILEADATGGGALGGLLSGTQFATNQDAIAVQSYLTSRDAMNRLEEDLGFKEHFSQEWLDPIKRLEPDASDEAAYKIFKKNVKIGYDPTEGVIRMEVIAADPQVSAAFSEHLISYAEQRVDDLSRRKREDQMREAKVGLETAKKERREAQMRLVALQEGTLLDPEGEIASIRALMNNVEMQLQDKELQLQTMQNNARPNKSRVDALEVEIRLLSAELERQSARLNDATNGETSLAAKAAQIQMAQADLATTDLFLQSALQNEKQTAQEANRQVRYLTTSVRPVAPDDATYPLAFENTILAFLILSGVYLMFSLTASILREQVSS
ncbi:capsule biosynthesis protein [Thalassovita taeanensis]|uniref:Capsular polysaccharide transport system permease protein n=1 Tax=Thalassovita taeanensis TaxID=657014 RepID=A0A1H9DET4_9RHOB|nr:capsule biosynthesis protein [Thalassovita taeanensis]SEQ11258.1 capsular polysaccharide transport system permease protein [Thalassovita taeanensis]